MIQLNARDANLLVAKLVNFEKKDIKKLSQNDRKICLKAFDVFLSGEGEKEFKIHLPAGLSFVQKVENIQTILKSKKPPKKFLLIRLITSLVKRILNLLHLRIGSDNLFERMRIVRDKFLNQNWDQYLQDNFDLIETNCNLDEANIFFLGDEHTDVLQKNIRINLIRHFTKNEEHNNFLLDEGISPSEGTKLIEIDGKKLSVESWEVEEHKNAHGALVNEKVHLLIQLKEKIRALKELKRNKPQDDLEVTTLRTELDQLKEKLAKVTVEFNHFKELRDQDLIQKVKSVAALNPNQKIFIRAGRAHLIENEYKIINSFEGYRCAVLFPLSTGRAEEISDTLFKKAAELDNYVEAQSKIIDEENL